jgi:hypothetical protein
VYFPDFYLDSGSRIQNFLFTDSSFGPTYTNEFRFSYGRLNIDQARIPPGASPLARTLPQIIITNIAGPGVPSDLVAFRDANNLLFQETQTKLSGRHTFLRVGAAPATCNPVVGDYYHGRDQL